MRKLAVRGARVLSKGFAADVEAARENTGRCRCATHRQRPGLGRVLRHLEGGRRGIEFPGARPRDPFNQAEGYRYLSRLTRGGLMAFVEYSDPRAPVLHRVAHETVKLGADNPDNYYQTAAIQGDFDYRISGRRNNVKYLSFGTQAGHYGQGGGMPPTGYIEAADIETDADGRFELIVSSTPSEGNWLPMQSDTGTLIVRQTFLDREKRSAGGPVHRAHQLRRGGRAPLALDARADRRRP